MDLISRSEIMREPYRWIIYPNLEGKEVFRELEQYGNRHAVFDIGAEWGYVHYDQYNATSFPTGTINHVAKWTNEKTGINETFARLLGWSALLYAWLQSSKVLGQEFLNFYLVNSMNRQFFTSEKTTNNLSTSTNKNINVVLVPYHTVRWTK